MDLFVETRHGASLCVFVEKQILISAQILQDLCFFLAQNEPIIEEKPLILHRFIARKDGSFKRNITVSALSSAVIAG